MIELENNSNVKNAVKAAIKDAKDYLGNKGKQGLEKTAELLEKLEFKSLTEKQQAIARYLDEAGARGGLTESEIAVLGIIYAANATLFPTSALDVIPGAGKAVSKSGELIKAGIKAEDAAKVAAAEVRTGSHSLDSLSRAAGIPGKGDLTAAGNSLNKHGTGKRDGNSLFPAPAGNPAAINRQGAEPSRRHSDNPGYYRHQRLSRTLREHY